jgi:ligand-binding sensor domain-containing protein
LYDKNWSSFKYAFGALPQMIFVFMLSALQEATNFYSKINIEMGPLPKTVAYTIAQDADGFMWFENTGRMIVRR